MKTHEELDALTRELAELNTKLAELSEEELEQVAGGGSESEIVGSGLFIPTPDKPANPRKIAEE